MMPSNAIEERRSGTDRRAVPRGTERRCGRRPLVEGEEPYGMKVPTPHALYDEVYAYSRTNRISVPEVVRRALKLFLRSEGINYP